jgi:hypothetical protein
MSLHPFIYHSVGGKIRLKYRIIEEKYNRVKRNFIESILIVVILVEIIGGTLVINTQYGLPGIAILFILTIVIELRIYKIINRSTQTGMIFFDEDCLTISTENNTTLPYKDIKRIYFKMHLKSTRQGGRNRKVNATQAHSYILQLNTVNKQFMIKVENDLWLTEEDKLQFHRFYPLMMFTLEEIYKRYRIPMEEKPRKFKFEAF